MASSSSSREQPFSSLQPLTALMDKCVHCGFCLSTCPSYVLLGQEMDSPRGRIYLMRAGAQNRIALSESVVGHFDTCLGCMACETACPSGVRYAPLIEETRAAIEHGHPRSAADRLFRRLLFMTLPYPTRLRLLALPLALIRGFRRRTGLLSRLPARIRNLIALAPDADGKATARVPERTAAQGETRARVGLVTGCVQQVFFGSVNEATARLLSAEGCEVVAPRRQGCCGALALHAGRDEDARQFARELIAAFEPHVRTAPGQTAECNPAELSAIVINAAGCGSTMKGYGELLQHDPLWADRAREFAARVRDVSEVLASLQPPRAPRHPLSLRVAYHDACHLAHAQGIRREPRQLLESIPGVTLVPVAEAELCCGSAGIFNLVEPELAGELGQRKVSRLADAQPDVVVTSNPGCILQMRTHARTSGRTFRVLHLVELLDASRRGVRL
jgi:glycolate oxidase iron-sulfur subunit